MINCSKHQSRLWPPVEVWPGTLSMNPKTLKNHLGTRLNDIKTISLALSSTLQITKTFLAYCESYYPLLPSQFPCLGGTLTKSLLEELPVFLGIYLLVLGRQFSIS